MNSVIRIPSPRTVIDRRELVLTLDKLVETHSRSKTRQSVVKALRDAQETGRKEIARRLVEKPSAGHEVAEAQAFLTDQLIRVIHDYVVRYVYPASNRSKGERLTIMAVGGYGR
ncbi:MAG: bifunctional uridylyltransferase/uridylyl-removing protein, partial [Novosphingobium sp.]